MKELSEDIVQDDPVLEVVIPNWNGAEMLRTCLDSLFLQNYKKFKITVVDNGSTDGSLGLLARDYPTVRVLSFAENRGFSVAVNAGLRKGRAKWVVLLNNDIEVAPDCFGELVKGVARHPEADFFAIKMYNFYQREILDGAGDAMLRGGVGYRIGTMEHDNEFYSADRNCFGACAGAALYSHRVFEKIGYFDEDFFAYLEDVDLNVRASMAGLQCVFLSKAKVYHLGSATTGSKFNPLTIRLSTRNNISLLVKNYPSLLLLRFCPAILVYQLMWFLFCLKKRLFSSWFHGMFEAFSPLRVRLFYTKHSEFYRKYTSKDVWKLGSSIVLAEREAIHSIMARRTENGKNNLLFVIYLKLFC